MARLRPKPRGTGCRRVCHGHGCQCVREAGEDLRQAVFEPKVLRPRAPQIPSTGVGLVSSLRLREANARVIDLPPAVVDGDQVPLGSLFEANRRDGCCSAGLLRPMRSLRPWRPSGGRGGCASNVNPFIGALILLPSDCRLVREELAAYARPSLRRGAFEIATSVLSYLAVSVLMYLALDVSYLLTLALALPAAGFLVRTFVVFHDCAHGLSYPPSAPIATSAD